MRLTYLDESGTNAKDPHLVVAGVIVDGDKQLAPVEDYMETLVVKHIPEPDRPGFVFHASDIWNGNEYFKDRELWPWFRRESILRDLVGVIPKFRLPVCVGIFDRLRGDRIEFKDSASSLDRTQISHSFALMDLALGVEEVFRSLWPDEITILVHEDRHNVREELKAAILMLRFFNKTDEAWQNMWPPEKAKFLPLTRIRDTTLFAAKDDCCLLQLADVCAFFFRGTLADNQAYWPYHDVFAPQVIAYPQLYIAHHSRAMKGAADSGDLASVFDPWGRR